MTVSIVVPVYNVEQYIQRCFHSICKQTYEHSLLECIFVDDCGVDGSMEKLKELLGNYDGEISFVVVNHEVNQGLSEARNSGTRIAKGEYIYYFDSDDELTGDCIESLALYVKEHEGVDIVMGSSNILNNGAVEADYWLKSDLPDFSEDRIWLKKAILKRTFLPMTAWNKLIRLEFIKEYNLFFKQGIIHEDEHWEFFVAKYVKTAAFCKTVTYLHYINEGSIVTTVSPRQIECMLIIIEDFLNNIDDVLPKEQYKTIYYLAFFALIKAIDDHDKAFAKRVKRTMQNHFKARMKRVAKRLKIIEFNVLLLYFLPIQIISVLRSKVVRNMYYGLLRIM